MIADVVVAAMTPDALAEALPAVHHAGLGHTARLMRAERGDPRGQLRRAGIPVESGPARLASEGCLLTVAAAARSQAAAALLLRHGASAVWIVSPAGFWRNVDDGLAVAAHRTAEPVPHVELATPALDNDTPPAGEPASTADAIPGD